MCSFSSRKLSMLGYNKNRQCMQSIFRTAFYLRSNYVNKEGKTPVMLRIYLNNERMSLGSTGITIVQSQWDREKERVKGRHPRFNFEVQH